MILNTKPSPSSRRAWIEIKSHPPHIVPAKVALLAEGVDRNIGLAETLRVVDVALLAEGVDRNVISVVLAGLIKAVALLAEGVDRN